MILLAAALALLAQDKIESKDDGYELEAAGWKFEKGSPDELKVQRDLIRKAGGKIQGCFSKDKGRVLFGTVRFSKANYLTFLGFIEKLVAAAGQPEEGGAIEEAQYDFIKVNGAPAAQYQIVFEDDEGVKQRVVLTAVFSVDRFYVFSAHYAVRDDKSPAEVEKLLKGLKISFDTKLQPPEIETTATRSFRVPGAKVTYPVISPFKPAEQKGRADAEFSFQRSFIRVFGMTTEKEGLEKMGEEARSNLEESLKEANSPTRKVGEGKIVSIGDLKVYEFETEHAYPGTLSRGIYRVIETSKGSCVHLLSVAPSGEYEYLKPAFDKFVKELQVQEDPATALPAEGRDELEKLRKEADALRKARRLKEIVPMWEGFIKKYPKYAFGHDGLGRALLALGEYEKALACFERMVEAVPDLGEANRMLAVCRLELGKPREALEAVESALKTDPDNDSLIEMRANIYVELGRFLEAHKDVDRIEKAAGKLDGLLLRAKLDILEGIEKSAIERLAEAEKLAENSNEWESIADIYDDLELNDDVLRCYGKAVDLDLDNDTAILGLARALSNVRRYEDALKEVDRLLKRQPQNSGAIGLKIRVLYDLGRGEEAKRTIEAAVKKNPDDPWLFVRRAWVIRTREGKFEEGIDDLKKACELTSRTDLSEETMAQLLQLSGKPDESVPIFKKILKKHERMSLFNISDWLHRDYDFLHLYWGLRLAGKGEEAKRSAEEHFKTRAGTAWSRLLARCLAGEIGFDELSKFATNDLRRCEADFWYGVRLSLDGKDEEAKASMEACVKLQVTHYIEHTFATLYLEGHWPKNR